MSDDFQIVYLAIVIQGKQYITIFLHDPIYGILIASYVMAYVLSSVNVAINLMGNKAPERQILPYCSQFVHAGEYLVVEFFSHGDLLFLLPEVVHAQLLDPFHLPVPVVVEVDAVYSHSEQPFVGSSLSDPVVNRVLAARFVRDLDSFREMYYGKVVMLQCFSEFFDVDFHV